jgi:hypothetical protein
MWKKFEGDPKTTTLHDAKVWLQGQLLTRNAQGQIDAGEGAICPACKQVAKVYARQLHSSMAYVLIEIVKKFRSDPQYRNPEAYLHVGGFINSLGLDPKVAAAIRGDWTKLKYWGLIAPQPGERDDASPRNGYWRPTAAGEAFATGFLKVPRYMLIYNDHPLKYEAAETDLITIRDALGTAFNFGELMAGYLPDDLEL